MDWKALPKGAPFLLLGFGGLRAGMGGFRRELRSPLGWVSGVLEACAPSIHGFAARRAEGCRLDITMHASRTFPLVIRRNPPVPTHPPPQGNGKRPLVTTPHGATDTCPTTNLLGALLAHCELDHRVPAPARVICRPTRVTAKRPRTVSEGAVPAYYKRMPFW